MKVFIAGFGNPFREDDSVGLQLAPQIAEWLEEEGFEVNLWIGQQLLPELALQFGTGHTNRRKSQSSLVLFL